MPREAGLFLIQVDGNQLETKRRVLENWLYWIVFDAIAVFLYASQGLVFVALQFVAYLVIAAVGFVTWLRSRRVPVPSG